MIKTTRSIFNVLMLAALLCAPAWPAITFETPDCLVVDAGGSNVATFTNANLGAGSNRVVTVQVRYQTATTWTSVTATFGGVAMTTGPLAGESTTTGDKAFYILESALSALSPGTHSIVLTGTGTVSTAHATVTQLNGAAQQAPEQTGTHSASVEAAPIPLTPLTIGAGVVYDVRTTSDRTTTIAVGGGLTESCPSQTTFGRRGISGRLIADGDETPTSTWTTATLAHGTAMAFAPAAVVTPATEAAIVFPHFPKNGSYEIQAISYPDAEEGVAYTGPEPVAVRGKAPYVWALLSGSAPRGLSIEGGACE